MGFETFLGNEATVHHLREAIAGGRIPAAMVLAGPRGAGKYTLALMLAQTINCLTQPVTNGLPDFCGSCSNCIRIAASSNLEARVEEAIHTREEMRDADKKDTRILIQTHPDLLVIPPDPPQLLIKMGQVRHVIRSIYRLPAEARHAVYIFTTSAFMKEAANSILKILEEPPPYASIFLLAENPGELLPTIRSRTVLYQLGALPVGTLEQLLSERRPDWTPPQRALVARLAEGAVGRAIAFRLDEYLASRQDALLLLKGALSEPDHTALFKMTETYRGGADGQQKTIGLLRAMSSLLEDLLLLHSGAQQLTRNIDVSAELARMAEVVTVAWIEAAVTGMDQVESGMRRNLLRSLSLDAFATGLAPG